MAQRVRYPAHIEPLVQFVEETGRPTRMYVGDGWIDRVQ